jgi:hypothetical protein
LPYALLPPQELSTTLTEQLDKIRNRAEELEKRCTALAEQLEKEKSEARELGETLSAVRTAAESTSLDNLQKTLKMSEEIVTLKNSVADLEGHVRVAKTTSDKERLNADQLSTELKSIRRLHEEEVSALRDRETALRSECEAERQAQRAKITELEGDVERYRRELKVSRPELRQPEGVQAGAPTLQMAEVDASQEIVPNSSAQLLNSTHVRAPVLYLSRRRSSGSSSKLAMFASLAKCEPASARDAASATVPAEEVHVSRSDTQGYEADAKANVPRSGAKSQVAITDDSTDHEVCNKAGGAVIENVGIKATAVQDEPREMRRFSFQKRPCATSSGDDKSQRRRSSGGGVLKPMKPSRKPAQPFDFFE